jgi:methylated-DNA-protein-cysteine methyltransferase-like protein
MNLTTPPLYSRIYALVRQIPPGRVTTYGCIARTVGCPARLVGFAMAALPAGHDLPWQRVVNSEGKISPRREGDGARIQRALLEAEGVGFDADGRIPLARYAWETGLGGAQAGSDRLEATGDQLDGREERWTRR